MTLFGLCSTDVKRAGDAIMGLLQEQWCSSEWIQVPSGFPQGYPTELLGTISAKMHDLGTGSVRVDTQSADPSSPMLITSIRLVAFSKPLLHRAMAEVSNATLAFLSEQFTTKPPRYDDSEHGDLS